MEKFLFHKNVFDSDAIDDEEEELEEELPPPPPTFSEDELAAAKKTAFADGKKEGIEETKAGQLSVIEKLVERVSEQIKPFFEQEAAREKRFEEEAVHLSLTIFEALFPRYKEEHGLAELSAAVQEIVSARAQNSAVEITLNPADIQDAETYLAPLKTQYKLEIVAGEHIEQGSCALSWNDGGGLCDMAHMEKEIQQLLLQALEERGVKRHDTCIDPPVEDDLPHAETQEEQKDEDEAPASDIIVAKDTGQTDDSDKAQEDKT